MKTATEIHFQGDVMFTKVTEVPKEATKVQRRGPIIAAHSETGHHHVINAADVIHFETPDPFICYLQLGEAPCDIEHMRSYDTHETVRLLGQPGDAWKISRQREMGPEGWQRAAD